MGKEKLGVAIVDFAVPMKMILQGLLAVFIDAHTIARFFQGFSDCRLGSRFPRFDHPSGGNRIDFMVERISEVDQQDLPLMDTNCTGSFAGIGAQRGGSIVGSS